MLDETVVFERNAVQFGSQDLGCIGNQAVKYL